MTKINNSDIGLPMALNFEETLEYIKRPKCYFKSQISGYIKSKSKTTPIMFNLKLEHTKSEARREVDNLSEGIANEIKLNKYINIDPIIDEMELDREDLKFKLKAEIDGTEIQIPTKINLNSKKPEFEGISLNDTNNNIEYALETLIDGVYIVSRKYEEKSLDKDNIECSFKVSIEYGLKLEYNNQQLNFGTEVVFSSEEELLREVGILLDRNIDNSNVSYHKSYGSSIWVTIGVLGITAGAVALNIISLGTGSLVTVGFIGIISIGDNLDDNNDI